MSAAGLASDERITPQWLIDALVPEFRFAIDLAALRSNCRIVDDRGRPVYLGPDHQNPQGRDALAVAWHALKIERPVGWLNPPYSRGNISRFLAKCVEEAEQGFTTVSLFSADTSTRYYHEHVLSRRFEVRHLRSRLSFEGAPRDKDGRLAPAKFGSVLVIYRPTHKYWTYA